MVGISIEELVRVTVKLVDGFILITVSIRLSTRKKDDIDVNMAKFSYWHGSPPGPIER